jgi:hypothetical protein
VLDGLRVLMPPGRVIVLTGARHGAEERHRAPDSRCCAARHRSRGSSRRPV